MNGYFGNGNFKEEKNKGTSLPLWLWILGIIGLVIAVVSGYFYGVQAVDVYGEVMSSIVIQDTNGEDTSLQTLDFYEFLGVFDNVYGYNFFDSDMSFAFSYNSTVKYNNAKGCYPNGFSDSETVNYKVDFKNFNYYDVTYAKRSETAVTFTFTSEVLSGNLEAKIFRIDDNYRVKGNDRGVDIIDATYLYEEVTFSANKTETVTLPGGAIYVLAVGCENADGSYTFTAK